MAEITLTYDMTCDLFVGYKFIHYSWRLATIYQSLSLTDRCACDFLPNDDVPITLFPTKYAAT
jgi:hypothetical protein